MITQIPVLAFDAAHPEKIALRQRLLAEPPGIIPYADGQFAWTHDDLARFPDSPRRFITVLGDAQVASIGDVERFDMRPADAPGFLTRRHDLVHDDDGTIYCCRDCLPRVEEACAGLTFGYNIWLATLDGTFVTSVPGKGRLVAVQAVRGPGYDITLAAPGWLRHASS